MTRSRLLDACRGKEVDCTPVWFMRQAGRHMPEYRAMREKYDILTLCKTPELAAKLTLLPVEKFGVDGAIIFSDILLPLDPMGLKFSFNEKLGPVIHNPLKAEEVNRLRVVDPHKELSFVLEAIRLARKRLDENVALIGFSGAPFTLASYIIEGGSSRDFSKTRRMMYSQPEVWNSLMHKLSETISALVRAQADAGAQIIQIFDSWVGCLGASEYEEYVLPYTKKIFDSLRGLLPTIHFGTCTSTLLELMKEAGGDVLGIDWRIQIDLAWKRLGEGSRIQGNLDPAVLLGNEDIVTRKTRDILKRVNGRRGHIFNLGHGVLPGTPSENIKLVVHLVRSYGT